MINHATLAAMQLLEYERQTARLKGLLQWCGEQIPLYACSEAESVLRRVEMELEAILAGVPADH